MTDEEGRKGAENWDISGLRKGGKNKKMSEDEKDGEGKITAF